MTRYVFSVAYHFWKHQQSALLPCSRNTTHLNFHSHNHLLLYHMHVNIWLPWKFHAHWIYCSFLSPQYITTNKVICFSKNRWLFLLSTPSLAKSRRTFTDSGWPYPAIQEVLVGYGELASTIIWYLDNFNDSGLNVQNLLSCTPASYFASITLK